jgi:hypothetical protein
MKLQVAMQRAAGKLWDARTGKPRRRQAMLEPLVFEYHRLLDRREYNAVWIPPPHRGIRGSSTFRHSVKV